MNIDQLRKKLQGLLTTINPLGDTNPNQAGNQNFWTNTFNQGVTQPFLNTARMVPQVTTPLIHTIGQGMQSFGRLAAYTNPLESNQTLQSRGVPTTAAPLLPDVQKALAGKLAETGAALAPIGTVTGGLIGGAMQAGENLFHGQPLQTNIPQAVGQGINFGAMVSPISAGLEALNIAPKTGQFISNVIGNNPLASKLSAVGGNAVKEALTGAGYGLATGQNPISQAGQFAAFAPVGAGKIEAKLPNAKGMVMKKTYDSIIPKIEDNIKNVIARYELTFGEGYNPSNPRVDLNLEKDAQNVWKTMYGLNRTPPEDLKKVIGQIFEGYHGWKAELENAQNGIRMGIQGDTTPSSSKISQGENQPTLLNQTIPGQAGEQSSLLQTPSQKTANPQINPLESSSHSSMPSSFNAEQYIKDMVKQQEDARKSPIQGITTKLGNFYNQLKKALIDSNAPIEDVLTNAEKEYNFQVRPTNDIRLQIDKVYRASAMAGQFAKDNGLVDVIQKAPNLVALDQYMIAKQAADVYQYGKETGRNIEKDRQLVNALAPVYEPFAQAVNQYSRKLLQYSVDAGLIDKDAAAYLIQKYPNYVPLNRIFNEMEQAGGGFGAKGVASLSKQTVVQKLEGSTRAIENPIASLLDKTQTAFEQGERNIAARQLASYKDLPGNPFNITPLRTAENVNKRIDLYSQASDLKPIQNKLARLLQTRKRWGRQLESQINNLNKQGLYLSLKEKFVENPTIQSSIDQTNTYKKNLVDIGTDKFYAPEKDPNIKLKQNYAVPTKSEFKNIINNLVNLSSSEINAIKSKIATRENNLAPIMDQIANLSDDLHGVKQYRSGLFDEAHSLRDIESNGKSTFSVLKDGVKEIYQTTPEVAAAAKSLNKQQMGILEKIVSIPTRALRLGATGLNYPFAIANLAKDQTSAVINSHDAKATSLLTNPNAFLQGLFAAVGHNDLYQEVVRNAAGGTSFDIGRSNPNLTVEELRATRNVGSKLLYKVTHPEQLIRTAEDIIGRTEELTRVQQYKGMYDALIKQGRTPEDARLLAAKAARDNTVNFARGGDFSRVLNWVIPYFNAGVQGSRTFVRNVQTRPAQTLTKFAIGVGMPVAAATVWNLSDPERKKAYYDINEYEKQNSIIIVPPHPIQNKDGSWNVIKIPLSQEVAQLSSVIRRPLEQAAGLDPVKVGEMANALFQTATSLNAGSATSLASSTTPQFIKPVIEAQTNKNLFTGNDIVPSAMRNLPSEQQVKATTSGTARLIGKTFNASPLLVQNEASTILGGLGPQLLNVSDNVLNKAGVIPDNQVSSKSPINALDSRFLKATGGRAQTQLDENLKKGLTPKETQAYDLIHTPRMVDSQGNTIPDNPALNSQKNALLYLNYPKLQQIDTAKAQLEPNHDPIWDLPQQQRSLVFAARTALPNQTNSYKKALQSQPWYDVFQQAESQYFNSLPTQSTAGSSRPQPSAYVQQQMNAKNFKDPQVQAFLNANSAYNNSTLMSLGLPPVNNTYSSHSKKISFSKIHLPKVKLTKANITKFKAPKQIKLKIAKSKTKTIKFKPITLA